MEEERTSSGLLGWLAAFVLTAVVAGLAVFFIDLGPKKEEPAIPSMVSALSPPPPPPEATSANAEPETQAAEQPAEVKDQKPAKPEKASPPKEAKTAHGTAAVSAPPQQADAHQGTAPVPDVVSGVAGLDDAVGLPTESEVASSLLEKSTFCRKGRIAHRAPSLFGTRGFAITYGTNTFANGGDPFPRLEIFVNETNGQRFASVLSLTADPVPGFPNNQETAMPWDDGALRSVIARWVEGASDGVCPVKGQTDGS